MKILANLNKPLIWIILAFIIGLIYLATASYGYGYSGFPLDDAWIHQTYARNLGQHGEFAFTPGIPSTGSTAPLWTLLLSLGYALGIPYKWWTFGLGIILLGSSGYNMARLGRRLFQDQPWLGPIVGLAMLIEWHLGWAAVSGMETLLFIWLSIYLMERYVNLKHSGSLGGFFMLGILGGLLTLVRPEGMGLLGLIGIEIAVSTLPHKSASSGVRDVLLRWLMLSLGFMLAVLPYLIFNFSTTQLLLPNTFYAKQQEYGLWINEQFSPVEALIFRLRVLWTPFVGMQILLLPGIVMAVMTIWKQRNTVLAILVIWWLSNTLLYIVRLPVTYQHGRYQMPIIPWILLLGIWGTSMLLKLHHRQLWPRIVSRVALISMIIIACFFIILGIQAYARDVRIIETEMVDIARWLHENTEQDTIIAAHDIGAIGYFTERPLIDLAGLITPDVIPFIRDEAALRDFSREQNATYLVTFPSWYPTIAESLPKIYSTDAPWAIEAGSDNMAIFSLK